MNKTPLYGGAKILLFDIETMPIEALVWDMYETNVIKIIKDWYMISFSYKWLGEKDTHVLALPDYKDYTKDRSNDKKLVTDLWKLFEEADIIVGHNGDKFDIKKTNARFIKHNLPPLPEPKTVDTLKVAKKHFKFTSNKLNDLGEFLGLGQKEKTGGIDLWLDCRANIPKAWKLMKKYNKQDVVLLEAVYLKLSPWFKNHPNVNLHRNLPEQRNSCPACGSRRIQRRGFELTSTTRYQRLQCQDCGKWSRERKSFKEEVPTVK